MDPVLTVGQHALELTLARELSAGPVPSEACLMAAKLVLANQSAVLRFLKRIEPHPVDGAPHRLGPTHLRTLG